MSMSKRAEKAKKLIIEQAGAEVEASAVEEADWKLTAFRMTFFPTVDFAEGVLKVEESVEKKPSSPLNLPHRLEESLVASQVAPLQKKWVATPLWAGMVV